MKAILGVEELQLDQKVYPPPVPSPHCGLTHPVSPPPQINKPWFVISAKRIWGWEIYYQWRGDNHLPLQTLFGVDYKTVCNAADSMNIKCLPGSHGNNTFIYLHSKVIEGVCKTATSISPALMQVITFSIKMSATKLNSATVCTCGTSYNCPNLYYNYLQCSTCIH